MASNVNGLKMHHLRDLRALLWFEKNNIPTLRFETPSNKGGFKLEATSDASMANAAEGGALGAFSIVRRCGDITHPILWSARNLRHFFQKSQHCRNARSIRCS